MAMKAPNVGELKHKITIKLWRDVPNLSAGIDQTFTEPAIAWAKIEPVGTAIYFDTKQTDNKITHRFYIRFIAGVTSDHVIEHDGWRYRIARSAPMQFERRFLVIEAEQLGSI